MTEPAQTDDLVQRLRTVAAEALAIGGCQECGFYGEDGEAAADEIERLQADNQRLRDDFESAYGRTDDLCDKVIHLELEVVRLQQALRDLLDALDEELRYEVTYIGESIAAARAVLDEGNQQ